MRQRFTILTILVIISTWCVGCIPVDKVAAILGYVPAAEPGLVQQVEDLITSIQNEFGD